MPQERHTEGHRGSLNFLLFQRQDKSIPPGFFFLPEFSFYKIMFVIFSSLQVTGLPTLLKPHSGPGCYFYKDKAVQQALDIQTGKDCGLGWDSMSCDYCSLPCLSETGSYYCGPPFRFPWNLQSSCHCHPRARMVSRPYQASQGPAS